MDTLETRYQERHQSLQLVNEMMNFLLDKRGIKEIKLNETGTKVVSAQDGTPGYILSSPRSTIVQELFFAGDHRRGL